MAEETTKRQESLLKSIRTGVADVYKRTFYTPPDGESELKHLSDRINDSMGKIINDINYSTGLSSISTLYAKSLNNDNAKLDGFDDIFGDLTADGGVYNAFFNNRSLRLFDAEIDMICKYMPMLEDAIGVLCDNVISSDHFSKDYIFISDENVSVEKDKEEFYNNINILKDKYDLLQKFQDIIYNTSKYGERFYYIVPYERAIKKVLNNPDNQIITSRESMTLNESGNIIDASSMFAESVSPYKSSNRHGDKQLSVDITFNMSNTFSDILSVHEKAINRYKNIKESSINFNEATTSTVSLVANDKLDASPFYDDTSSNGLITSTRNGIDTKKDWGLNGCLFKELNRYKIIPIRVDDLILGYAYLENDKVFGLEEDFPVSDTTTPVNSLGINKATDLEATKNAAIISDGIIKTVASKLSKAIDEKFIKLNKDLSKEIYTVLKHDLQYGKNKYTVTFLPPDDVVHCYYSLDPDTYRGISDLYKSMIPAKLFIGLYITNTVGAMTRSQDRRVYYVKQSGIDTNISKILLTTIDQLKRQNFNIRQLESMKNVLNILGRFNDFVIPTDSSGNAPVNFEVMQGQQIDPQTELMEKLQNMAINSTDVPVEIVQARQSMDYAIQATMSNSRFLKKVYNRQTIANKFLSAIMTKLYRGEFNNPTAVIKVTLPTPMFLNLTNTNQVIQNANDIAQAAAEAFSDDLPENAKNMFLNNIKGKYLESYIDMGMIARIKRQTEIEYAAIQTDDQSSGDGY